MGYANGLCPTLVITKNFLVNKCNLACFYHFVKFLSYANLLQIGAFVSYSFIILVTFVIKVTEVVCFWDLSPWI